MDRCRKNLVEGMVVVKDFVFFWKIEFWGILFFFDFRDLDLLQGSQSSWEATEQNTRIKRAFRFGDSSWCVSHLRAQTLSQCAFRSKIRVGFR